MRCAPVVLVLTAATAGCAEVGTGPVRPALQAGRYVLSTLGGEPAPFIYYRVDHGDTLSLTLNFTFDTIRIVSDTVFRRHFRREALMLRPGRPDSLLDQEEFDYEGIILDRGDEVKLTTRFGAPGGSPIAYFVPLDSALARHTQISRYLCGLESCNLTLDRRVDAFYARR